MLRLCFFWRQNCYFLLGLLQLVYLACSIWLPSATAALPPNPRLQTSYPPSTHFASSPSAPSLPPHAPGSLSTSPASSSLLNPLGLFNGTLAVSEPGALNCHTFFRFNLLILIVSKNLTLIHFSLSGSLDSLLSNLIAPTLGLAFSLSQCLAR